MKPLRTRVEALESQAATAQTSLLLIGNPTDAELAAHHRRGVRTIVIIPGNGRETVANESTSAQTR